MPFGITSPVRNEAAYLLATLSNIDKFDYNYYNLNLTLP
jgi:hypothetical protein